MAGDLRQPREQASFGEQAFLSQAIGIVSRTIDKKNQAGKQVIGNAETKL
jgi:hypothetical protein